MQTVKRMLSSGVDEATIRSTLEGVNLSEDEITRVIQEAKGGSTRETNNAGEEVQEGELSGEPGDDLEEDEGSEQIESMRQEQSAQHATTHELLDEHSQKLDDVHRNVSELHSKMDSASIAPEKLAKLDTFDARLISIEKQLGEIKANTNALQSLLKKILETDRQTLLSLKKK